MSVELAQEANFTFGAETHRIADLQLLGRLYKSPPMRAVDPFVQRRLDRGLTAASPYPPARQTGRDDLAVIDDKAVTGAQLIRQIADGTVDELRSLPGPHHQQSCGVPRRRRSQSNAIRRQVEIKKLSLHAVLLSWPGIAVRKDGVLSHVYSRPEGRRAFARLCPGHPRLRPGMTKQTEFVP